MDDFGVIITSLDSGSIIRDNQQLSISFGLGIRGANGDGTPNVIINRSNNISFIFDPVTAAKIKTRYNLTIDQIVNIGYGSDVGVIKNVWFDTEYESENDPRDDVRRNIYCKTGSILNSDNRSRTLRINSIREMDGRFDITTDIFNEIKKTLKNRRNQNLNFDFDLDGVDLDGDNLKLYVRRIVFYFAYDDYGNNERIDVPSILLPPVSLQFKNGLTLNPEYGYSIGNVLYFRDINLREFVTTNSDAEITFGVRLIESNPQVNPSQFIVIGNSLRILEPYSSFLFTRGKFFFIRIFARQSGKIISIFLRSRVFV